MQDAQPTITSAGAELIHATSTATGPPVIAVRGLGTHPRRASAAETSLELLRSRDTREGAFKTTSRLSDRRPKLVTMQQPVHNFSRPLAGHGTSHIHTKQTSITRPVASSSPDALNGRRVLSPDAIDSEQSSGGKSGHLGARIARTTRDPSASQVARLETDYPPELLSVLDGEHHTDEICTRFEVGWPRLRQWLTIAGGVEGAEGEAGFGHISIIYR